MNVIARNEDEVWIVMERKNGQFSDRYADMAKRPKISFFMRKNDLWGSTSFTSYSIIRTPPDENIRKSDAVIIIDYAKLSETSAASYFRDHGKGVVFPTASLQGSDSSHQRTCALTQFPNSVNCYIETRVKSSSCVVFRSCKNFFFLHRISNPS